MSFQVLLENCQGLSILDRGGKFIPPARNGEWKRSGKWFCTSLWWHHEASLTHRSQASGGDVDCHQWVEVGGCWAFGCSICKHQCLELDASCNRETMQGDKERCDIGPFEFAEDQAWTRSCAACCVRKGLIFLMLCNANLRDRAVFATWSLKSELVIKNYTKISDWTWWGSCWWIYLDGKIM